MDSDDILAQQHREIERLSVVNATMFHELNALRETASVRGELSLKLMRERNGALAALEELRQRHTAERVRELTGLLRAAQTVIATPDKFTRTERCQMHTAIDDTLA